MWTFPRVSGALATGASLALLVTTSVDAKMQVIRADAVQVTGIGQFRTTHTRSYAPTIRMARRAFGKPSNTFPSSRSGGCVVKWARLGLRILFTNFGSPRRSDCQRDVGLAQSFTVYKSKKIRTWRGLHIGVPDEAVPDYHPRADFVVEDPFYPDGWWLRTAESPYGDPHDYPVVEAIVTGDTVSSLYGWIGAAGD
jgi:hypothetical protein